MAIVLNLIALSIGLSIGFLLGRKSRPRSEFSDWPARTSRWRSADGDRNAQVLQDENAALFEAIAAVDKLGHQILARVGSGPKITRDCELVAIALLRRGITLFAGFRCLVEGSSVEPAKLVVRAQVETMFAMLHLVHGGPIPQHPILTKEVAEAQEKRARFFRTMAIRRAIYRRQAVLDGAWAMKPPSSEHRARIEDEIRSSRALLKDGFAEENAEVGDLRCYAQPPADKMYFDRPAWYTFGPGGKAKSIRQLAQSLGYLHIYELIYEALSALTHPRDYTQDLEIESGHANVLHPHNPEALALATKIAIMCARGIIITYCWAFQLESMEDVRVTLASYEPTLDAIPFDIPASFF